MLTRIIFLSVIVFLTACAGHQTFTGNWTYQGIELRGDEPVVMRIVSLDEDQFYIEGKNADYSGIYQLDEDVLIMIKPNNPRMGGFRLKIAKDVITIIAQPDLKLSGKKYLGGTFYREN